MAYVECPGCGRIGFSVPRWSSIDYCPRCGTTLPQGRRAMTPITSHPRFRRVHPQPPGPDMDDADGSAP